MDTTTDKEVYITNNSAKLLKDAYVRLISQVGDDIKKSVYKEDLSWILSHIEFKYLFAERLVLSESDFFKLTPQSIKKKDSGHLLVSNAPPKYHFRDDCEYSHRNYSNFSIPPELAARGEKVINEVRKFADENRKTLEEDEEKFFTMLEARFFLKQRPEKISFRNSGVREFSRLSLEEMEKAIEEHLEKCARFKEEHPEVANLNFAPYRVIAKDETSDIDKQWHKAYKGELKSMLRDYIRKRTSPNLSYSRKFLDSLGFEGCKVCGAEFDLT